MKECTVPDCGRVEYLARGFCDKHYKRWRKSGDPNRAWPTVEERFWAKVERAGDGECWLWIGARDPHGYGAFRVEGKATKAHRISYELNIGPIPAGLTIDHLCFNPPCVNPSHLEPVSGAENSRRATRRRFPDREAECVALYKSGLTQAQVAAAVGMDAGNVSRILARHSVTIRPQPRMSLDDERLRALAAAGHNHSQIAQALGVSRYTVRRRLRAYAETHTGHSLDIGWLLRIEGAP